jgi:poly(A) polymerase
MSDLTPRQPRRPLFWPDILADLQEFLADIPGEIYVIGGAVRDALLHRPLHDIDLATSTDAMRLARRIANHYNGDFFPLDADRDVGRALVDTPDGRLVFDVARFRGPGLLADLADRDFTLNAMAVDLHGDLSRLIDPLGGEADIAAGLIRRCSPDSLTHDPIRALRAIRQSIQLSMHIESGTLADIRAISPRLVDTSPERVRDEFFKLLALPKPASALRVSDTVGILPYILPELAALHGLPQSAPHVFDGWTHTLSVVENLSNLISVLDYNRSDNLATSFSMGVMAVELAHYRQQLREQIAIDWPNERSHRALLILAALLHDAGKPETATQNEGGRWRFLGHETVSAQMAEHRATALRLSNAETMRLVTIIQNHMRPMFLEELTPRAIHRFWRQLGEAGVDVCLLSLADYSGARGAYIKQDDWLDFVHRIRTLLEAYYDRQDTLVSPPVLVDGNDLMRSLKLKSGRIIGELLDVIREAQVAGEVQTTDQALELAQAYLDQKS